jgi:hypothetical protein
MRSPRLLRFAFAAALLTVGSAVSQASATEVTWVVSLTDSLYEYSSASYTDIKSITIGAVDVDPDNLVAIIYPRVASYLNFILSSDYGAISLDINGDSVDDFVLYAPRVSLSYYTTSSSLVFNAITSSPTGCYSKWSMTSAYDGYVVVIPWRCLGAPPSFRLEGWLSNSYSYDYLNYAETLTPVFAAIPTTTTATLPPVTAAPITLPPVTAPPITVPPSPPGFIDDWIEFLIVKQPVTLQDLLRTTDCCYSRGGARSMVVSPSSKSVCKARGRQLFPLKPGLCRVTISSGSGKNKLTEALKLRVKRSV